MPLVTDRISEAGHYVSRRSDRGVTGKEAHEERTHSLLPASPFPSDCKDVEVYAESAVNPGKDKKLGEYSLVGK